MKIELEINKKYGKWLIVKFDKVDSGRHRRYICRCECGLEKSQKASVIASGKSKSCYKCKREDLVGKIFGRWTVVEKNLESSKSMHTLWLCRCECGKTKFVERGNLISGNSRGCWECQKNVLCTEFFPRAWYRKQIEQAKTRKQNWNLDEKYLWQVWLSQKNKCSLSGLDLEINEDSKKMTASIDRIDSKKPYEKGNVWFVHKHINLMKYKFDINYFIEMCSFVAKHNY